MAYTLKSIRYQNTTKHILLQNENGPCPLLAASNALLLRGEITLPPASVRQNVATIEDVVNMLASRALLKSDTTDSTSSYHIDELLQLFPSLQYGMDVNPKFTIGPTGVEYTKELSAFDLMGVELVHGWLIDAHAQDGGHGSVIGSKTYNELTELMIMGNDASVEIEKIEDQIRDLQLKISKEDGHGDDDGNDDDDGADTSGNAVTDGVDKAQEAVAALNVSEESTLTPILEQLQKLQEERESQNKIYQHSSIISDFLSTTSTQLTYAGLTELHNYVKEGAMCVFFRNNHFSTMTKYKGILYLLITDLGYQNAPSVVWEKLDDISGDTEYVDKNFVATKPAIDLHTGANSLSPEQLLGQSSRAEADYQLALELSRRNDNAMDDQEGKLIAAATAASLQAYQNEHNGATVENNNETSAAETYSNTGGLAHNTNSGIEPTLFATAGEEQDKMMAMQLQRQFQEENARVHARSRATAASNRAKQKKDNSCIIC